MESATGSASSTDDELLSYMVKDRSERPSGDNELDSYLGDISAGSTLQFWEQNKSKYSGLFKLPGADTPLGMHPPPAITRKYFWLARHEILPMSLYNRIKAA
jgi:hypothetical protein